MKILEITKIDGSIIKMNEASLSPKGNAFISGRLLDYNPNNSLFEMSQYFYDDDGNEYRANWIFEEGRELDEYDYDLANAEIVEIHAD